MGRWLLYFFNVCRLKAAPQDAPLSRSVFFLTITLFWASGALTLLFAQPLIEAALLSAVETAILVFLTNLALWIRNTPERITQSITALAGSGTILAFISMPFMAMVGDANLNIDSLVNVIWIGLMIWETLIVAHVLRHAMDVPFLAGLGISLIFLYLSFAITLRFLKLIAVSTAG